MFKLNFGEVLRQKTHNPVSDTSDKCDLRIVNAINAERSRKKLITFLEENRALTYSTLIFKIVELIINSRSIKGVNTYLVTDNKQITIINFKDDDNHTTNQGDIILETQGDYTDARIVIKYDKFKDCTDDHLNSIIDFLRN